MHQFLVAQVNAMVLLIFFSQETPRSYKKVKRTRAYYKSLSSKCIILVLIEKGLIKVSLRSCIGSAAGNPLTTLGALSSPGEDAEPRPLQEKAFPFLSELRIIKAV